MRDQVLINLKSCSYSIDIESLAGFEQFKVIMIECWHQLPESRPSFQDVWERLNQLKDNIAEGRVSDSIATTHFQQELAKVFFCLELLLNKSHSNVKLINLAPEADHNQVLKYGNLAPLLTLLGVSSPLLLV